MSIPGGFPRNGVFSGSKTFNLKKFFLERYLCRGRAPNEHFMSKPAPKRGYPFFDSISLLGECPIFSGAQNVESNFRCHNENLTQHSGHRKKLGTRRAAKSNQNRGTPRLGRVLEGRGVCHSPSDKLPPLFLSPKKTRRTFEKLGALSHETSYFRIFCRKKSSNRSTLLT